MQIRHAIRSISDFFFEVSGLVILGLASSTVFALLLLVVAPSWQSAVGAGAFIGFVSLFSTFCLPSTGIASTTCSALSLGVYVTVASIAGFTAPLWLALTAAFSGFVLLPGLAMVSVLREMRRDG